MVVVLTVLLLIHLGLGSSASFPFILVNIVIIGECRGNLYR